MLNALYNDKILDFAAHIGQTERLPAPDATVTHHSPLCGSRITVDIKMDGDKVVGEERLLGDLDKRIRDVRVAANGKVYVLTDEDDGQLLELVPPAEKGSE